MSSYHEASSSDGREVEQSEISRQSVQTNTNPTNSDNEQGQSYVKLDSESKNTPKQNAEECSIHTRRKITVTKPKQTENKNITNVPTDDELYHELNVWETDMENIEDYEEEGENEFKELESFKAITNSEIYKLAYDENVPDKNDDENSMSPSRPTSRQEIHAQSQADIRPISRSISGSTSRSPSPVNIESQIPSSFLRDEIIVHEAGSDDDTLSEDLELLPHRYESESYLTHMQNKNVYINKLSLAAELLRTQENLPWDENFKRLVVENNEEPQVYTNEDVELEGSSSSEKAQLINISNKKIKFFRTRNEIVSQSQIISRPENVPISGTNIDSSGNDHPLNSQENENQDEAGAGNNRVQGRRRFSPFPFNPCFCCIIQ